MWMWIKQIWIRVKLEGAAPHASRRHELLEVRDPVLFKAVCAAACLVAMADGRVAPEEINTLKRAIRNIMEISGYAEDEALDYFQVCADALMANPANRLTLLHRVSAIRGKTWQARRVMRICLELSQADHSVDSAELEVLEQLCHALALEPTQFLQQAA